MEKMLINWILGLNIIFGSIHALSHILEERIIMTAFDLLFPVLTQIMIPITALFWFYSKNYNTKNFLNYSLILNFTIILLYSTFYHFLSESIDNISNSSNSLSGLLFIISSYILLILNIAGIIGFLILSLSNKN